MNVKLKCKDIDRKRYSDVNLIQLCERFPTKETDTLARYLVANNNNLDAATEQLKRADALSGEYANIRMSQCVNEIAKGSAYVHGHDRDGRPLIVVHARLHDPVHRNVKESVKMTLWWTEVAISRLPDEHSRFTILLDRAHCENAADTEYMQLLSHVFLDLHPERLHRAIVYPTGIVFYSMWNMVLKWFMAETTREKVLPAINLSDVTEYIDPCFIPAALGGTCTYKFNLSDFSDPVLPTSHGTVNTVAMRDVRDELNLLEKSGLTALSTGEEGASAYGRDQPSGFRSISADTTIESADNTPVLVVTAERTVPVPIEPSAAVGGVSIAAPIVSVPPPLQEASDSSPPPDISPLSSDSVPASDPAAQTSIAAAGRTAAGGALQAAAEASGAQSEDEDDIWREISSQSSSDDSDDAAGVRVGAVRMVLRDERSGDACVDRLVSAAGDTETPFALGAHGESYHYNARNVTSQAGSRAVGGADLRNDLAMQGEGEDENGEEDDELGDCWADVDSERGSEVGGAGDASIVSAIEPAVVAATAVAPVFTQPLALRAPVAGAVVMMDTDHDAAVAVERSHDTSVGARIARCRTPQHKPTATTTAEDIRTAYVHLALSVVWCSIVAAAVGVGVYSVYFPSRITWGVSVTLMVQLVLLLLLVCSFL